MWLLSYGGENLKVDTFSLSVRNMFDIMEIREEVYGRKKNHGIKWDSFLWGKQWLSFGYDVLNVHFPTGGVF